MIKVFIIWKKDLLLKCFEDFLNENNIEIVGLCKNINYAPDEMQGVDFEVLLLDIHWPKKTTFLSSFHMAKLLMADNPNLKIIFTEFIYDAIMVEYIKTLPVKGYLSLVNSNNLLGPEHWVTCIEAVHNNEFSFPPKKEN